MQCFGQVLLHKVTRFDLVLVVMDIAGKVIEDLVIAAIEREGFARPEEANQVGADPIEEGSLVGAVIKEDSLVIVIKEDSLFEAAIIKEDNLVGVVIAGVDTQVKATITEEDKLVITVDNQAVVEEDSQIVEEDNLVVEEGSLFKGIATEGDSLDMVAAKEDILSMVATIEEDILGIVAVEDNLGRAVGDIEDIKMELLVDIADTRGTVREGIVSMVVEDRVTKGMVIVIQGKVMNQSLELHRKVATVEEIADLVLLLQSYLIFA